MYWLLVDEAATIDLAEAPTGAWTGIKTRQHEVARVYSCSDAVDDLMILVLGFENGKTFEYDFSARAVIDDSKSKDPRFTFFQG
jgi:hypothetical protein